MIRRFLERLKPLSLLVVLLAVWQWVSGFLLPAWQPDAALLFPAPSNIAATGWDLISDGELAGHLLSSLRRVLVAFVFSAAAIPIGVAMAWWPGVNRQLYSIVEVLRPIPPLAWIPLSILWFGLGDAQNQFIIFLGMFFPLLINTAAGVRLVEADMLEAARTLGAGSGHVLWRVVLPQSLPHIVTGIRVALGTGWMALVAAELVGASSGLGFLINDARTLLRTDIVVVGMLSIGVTGLLLDIAVRRVGGRLVPWSQ
ncbi:MAG TPA: ABC transporter permease [Candidatus Sulfotelmatobacter sp.]|jgi:NitT/TauT family transport system permease protein/taurine transport system permease protein|nr:ABC transporter permease [Candidatus Sulfotelmatobacter sp.]